MDSKLVAEKTLLDGTETDGYTSNVDSSLVQAPSNLTAGQSLAYKSSTEAATRNYTSTVSQNLSSGETKQSYVTQAASNLATRQVQRAYRSGQSSNLAGNVQLPSYTTDTARNLAGRSNRLASRTSELNSGGFKNDIANYADRIFLQQTIGATRLTISAAAKLVSAALTSTPANLISIATDTKPIYTAPRRPSGTAPSADGRYNITTGYGFTLYGVLTNGGYGS